MQIKKYFKLKVKKFTKSDNLIYTESGYINISRGETQKNVNYRVLQLVLQKFDKKNPLIVMDLPCGSAIFLEYLRKLFPEATLYGADIKDITRQPEVHFVKMDLTKDFALASEKKFDLITSISGVMMFGNTLRFILNCSERLKKDGTFIITNDNSSTIIDKLAFLFLGRHRIFKPVYEDSEGLTQNIPIQELCRLLRTNGLTIEKIVYTSFYLKDIIYAPLAILVYSIQWLYIRTYKTNLPPHLKWQMFSFKHYFCKHYIIVARKC